MIKNIIFDFGAVLIPIDESRTWQEFESLGATKDLAHQEETFHSFEKGELSKEKFLKKIQPYFFRKIFPPELASGWNAMLKPLPSDRKDFLKKLKKEYRIFLLSNTNELHIAHIKSVAGPFEYKQFTAQFEKVYYSHELGMRKPDSEIYEMVLKENDLKPEETLYVDDGKKHISNAKKLGIKTWHFDPDEDDINDLDKVLSKHR